MGHIEQEGGLGAVRSLCFFHGDAMYVIDQVRDPDGEDSWISGLQFRQTVAGLTPREKRIMELRYLRGKTQMEVAQEIGISQAQVSRLEKGALNQFRAGH